MASFIGLHDNRGDVNDKSVITQIKRRICAKHLTLDKVVSTYTGRPPLISQRFVSTPPPLDIPDEVLFGMVPWEDGMLDADGWNTSGRIYAVTQLRARLMISEIRDPILEIALQANPLPSERSHRVSLLM